MIDAVSMFSPLMGTPHPGTTDPLEAGKQFEALFIQQVLSQMPVAGMGKEGEKWVGMFREQLARELVDAGGFGLADALARELGPARVAPESAFPAKATARLTSGFGERIDPIDGSRRRHAGVDVAAPLGSTVRAAKAGVVTFAGKDGGYGNLLVLDHGDGVETRYGHCHTLGVRPGDAIAAGQAIATVGATGRATGPHLHFELRTDGVAVDPHFVIEVPQVLVDPFRGVDRADPLSDEGPP